MTDTDGSGKKYSEPNRYRNNPELDRTISTYEFERLIDETYEMKPKQDLETRLVLLTLGRLGLRRGELGHLNVDWIDWDSKRIEIPEYHECTKGEGGGVCGHCKLLARQQADKNEDVSYEEALGNRWSPKTGVGSRIVPFGFSGRVELVLEQYFDEFDQWMYSAQGINRRINWIQERVDGVEDLDAHTLRSTAATYHLERGLDVLSLQKFMGWRHPIALLDYLRRSDEEVEQNLNHIHP